MARDFFYTKNDYLNDSPENVTFHQAHLFSEKQFNEWVSKLKRRIRFNWKKYEVPPASGSNDETSITEALQHLSTREVDDCVIKDGLSYKDDCLINRTKTASVVNNYFPNMWKTEDTSVGASAYQIFHTNRQDNRVRSLFRRHFTRDGFYIYTEFVSDRDTQIVEASNSTDWIIKFVNSRPDEYRSYDLFLDGKVIKPEGKAVITKSQLQRLYEKGYIKKRHLNKIEAGVNGSRIKFDDCPTDTQFFIRYYDTKQKLFPKGTRIFRAALNVDTTNFSPFVSKWIWLNYTEKFKNNDEIIVYDPSMGWAGRLAGALAASSQRKNMTYVGTDPNPDNWIDELDMSRYEYFAEHYKLAVSQPNYAKTDFFDCGSEVIHKQRRFQKYKNRINCAFTSPQYWTAEMYSHDTKQSAVKYPDYDDWVEGFLSPTIHTTAEYLCKGGHLLLNIANVAHPKSNEMMPLEDDAIRLIQEAGLKLIKKWKYVLGKPPGAGKIGKTHQRPTYRNFVEINSQYRKYEPIYVAVRP